MNNNRKYVLPLAFIGMMFFTVGFATGINGYFVPFLENITIFITIKISIK